MNLIHAINLSSQVVGVVPACIKFLNIKSCVARSLTAAVIASYITRLVGGSDQRTRQLDGPYACVRPCVMAHWLFVSL